MEREKFLGELAHLNVVPAQPGEVFHEHRRDVPGLDCGDHLLKAGAFHGGAGNTVIHEKDSVRVALVLGGLLKYFLLFGNVVALFLYQSAADFEIFQKNILSLPCPILHVMIILWKDIIVDNV